MKNKKLILLIFIVLLGCNASLFAAFPIKSLPVVSNTTATMDSATVTSDQTTVVATEDTKQTVRHSGIYRFFSRLIGGDGDHYGGHRGARSLYTAILLCMVGVFGVLGLHRFYLGYTWQGALQILGSVAGLVWAVLATGWVFVPGLLIFFLAMGIWQLIDFFRLITGDLQPKYGHYSNPGGGGRGHRVYHGDY